MRLSFSVGKDGIKKCIFVSFLFTSLMALLNVLATFPGYLYVDTKVMLHDGITGSYSIWHSIIYTLFLHGLTKVMPGPELINIINIVFLWLGIWLVSVSLFKRLGFVSFLFLLIPFFPGVLNLSGTPVIDQTLCDCLLLSVGLILFCDNFKNKKYNIFLFFSIIILLCISIMFRVNVIFSALCIAFCAVFSFFLKRRSLICLGCFVFFVGSFSIVNKTLAVKHSSPVVAVELKNLSQLSYYEQKNFFVGNWTYSPSEEAQILHGCYRPEQFDNLAFYGKCSFVNENISGKDLFRLWLKAVLRHPAELFVSDIPSFRRTILHPLNHTMMFNWPLNDENSSDFTHWHDREPDFKFFHYCLKEWVSLPYNRYFSLPIFSILLLSISIMLIYSSRRILVRSDIVMISVAVSCLSYMLVFFVADIATEYRYYIWAQVGSYIVFVYTLLTVKFGKSSAKRLLVMPIPLKGLVSLVLALMIVSVCYLLPVEHKHIEVIPQNGQLHLEHVAFNYAAIDGLDGGVKFDGTDTRFLGKVFAPGWNKVEDGYISSDNSKTFIIDTAIPYLDFYIGYKIETENGSFVICVEKRCHEITSKHNEGKRENDYLVESAGKKISSFHIYGWVFFFLLILFSVYGLINFFILVFSCFFCERLSSCEEGKSYNRETP